MKNGYVYIIGNEKPVLYIGVTSNLVKRISQHKQHVIKGFSSKYHIIKLLYFEEYPTIIEAIEREKQLKNWHRQWKLNLIITVNPIFRDLYETIL
jgi:putative endonuclease